MTQPWGTGGTGGPSLETLKWCNSPPGPASGAGGPRAPRSPGIGTCSESVSHAQGSPEVEAEEGNLGGGVKGHLVQSYWLD